MANKVNIGQNSKVNVKWRLLPIDYSEEAEKSIISKFAKKYGIPKDNISVEPQYITKSEEEAIKKRFPNIIIRSFIPKQK